MQFHAISILLHRPLFSRDRRNRDTRGEDFPSHARSLCISAAQSIVKLLRLYRKHHTLQRSNVQIVHLIFTASLICLYNAYNNIESNAANALEDLQFCCQALGEIGKCYRNATRALEVIICIKSDWFRKASRSAKFKRLNPIVAERGNLDIAPRKKRVIGDQTEEQERLAQKSSSLGTSASTSGPDISSMAQQNFRQLQSTMESFQDVNGMPREESLSPKFTLDDVYASEREFYGLGTYGFSSSFGFLPSQEREFPG